jgi:hypothetical protein
MDTARKVQKAQTLAVGRTSANTTNAVYPWPNQWDQTAWPPRQYVYPTVINAPLPVEEYANEVEVTRNEHDAVLRFYRRRSRSRSLVKEVTVPLALLDWLTKDGA